MRVVFLPIWLHPSLTCMAEQARSSLFATGRSLAFNEVALFLSAIATLSDPLYRYEAKLKIKPVHANEATPIPE